MGVGNVHRTHFGRSGLCFDLGKKRGHQPPDQLCAVFYRWDETVYSVLPHQLQRNVKIAAVWQIPVFGQYDVSERDGAGPGQQREKGDPYMCRDLCGCV